MIVLTFASLPLATDRHPAQLDLRALLHAREHVGLRRRLAALLGYVQDFSTYPYVCSCSLCLSLMSTSSLLNVHC